MKTHEPCPFCGSEDVHPRVFTGFHYFYAHVECDNCHAKGPDFNAFGETSCPIAIEGAWDRWDGRARPLASIDGPCQRLAF